MKAENTKTWWDEEYRKGEPWRYSKEPSHFLTSFMELLPPASKVLDLACGEGRHAVVLAKKGHQVTAIDFSEVAVERAKHLAEDSGVSIEFKTLDLDFFLPELLSFDAIVSIDFKPPPTLLKNLLRGLKQNGYLLMEAHLMEACNRNKSLEVFECFRSNELLKAMLESSSGLRVLQYSEMEGVEVGEKAYFIGRKTELL